MTGGNRRGTKRTVQRRDNHGGRAAGSGGSVRQGQHKAVDYKARADSYRAVSPSLAAAWERAGLVRGAGMGAAREPSPLRRAQLATAIRTGLSLHDIAPVSYTHLRA